MGSEPESQCIPAAIARELGRKIVSGRLRPGSMLDGEVRASEQLHVSRTAYREAVSQLIAKGLVESRPKVGTLVSEQKYWHLLDPEVLAWIFEFETEYGILSNLFEMRRMFEPEAAALAARRRTDEDLKAMRSALEAMSDYTLTTPEGQLADERFHVALLEASGNVFLRSLSGSISAAVQWTNIIRHRTNDHPSAVEDHRRIYDAVEASDGVLARRCMLHVIEFAFNDVQRDMNVVQSAQDSQVPTEKLHSDVVVMRSLMRAHRA